MDMSDSLMPCFVSLVEINSSTKGAMPDPGVVGERIGCELEISHQKQAAVCYRARGPTDSYFPYSNR